MKLDFIAIVMLIILSIVFNSIVVIIFLTNWSKLYIRDIIVLSLAIADLAQSLIGYPYLLTDYSNPPEQPATPQCIVSAFIVTITAVVGIAHIVALSLKYYMALVFPFWSDKLEKTKYGSFMFLVPAWCYGLTWGIFPLFGWSKYGKETETGYRCGLNLREHSVNVLSYNICLSLAAFVFPVLISIFCYFSAAKIFRTISKSAAESNGQNSKMQKETKKKIQAMYIVNGIMLFSFLLAWTPYAILVVMTMFQYTPNQTYFDIAAILAKTSSFYNPVIYAMVYKDFRDYSKLTFQKLISSRRRVEIEEVATV
ncbi:rhodopsin, G0-coupled-like [Clytia hemisphaerica]|uniref:rhodopsin, G0-coupled-like n=1 Tax=Clytia hemisphaerica TaxID=252671 RepID=UPI0034D6DE29